MKNLIWIKRVFCYLFLMMMMSILFSVDLKTAETEWGLEIENMPGVVSGSRCEDFITIKNKTDETIELFMYFADEPIDIEWFSKLRDISFNEKWDVFGDRRYYLSELHGVLYKIGPKQKAAKYGEEGRFKNVKKFCVISLNGRITDWKIYSAVSDLHIEIFGIDNTVTPFEDALIKEHERKRNEIILKKLVEAKNDKKNYQTGDFLWTFDDDGMGCKILAYLGDEKNVTIPSTIEGMPVTAIKSWLSKKAVEITIPSTVTTIESLEYNDKRYDDWDGNEIVAGSFWNCGLEKVNYEEKSNLSFVGEYAFGANNLKDFYLPRRKLIVCQSAFTANPIKNLYIYKDWSLAGTVYDEKYMPDSLKRYDCQSYASTGLFELETLEFEEGHTLPGGESAFKNCIKLEKVILPKTIEGICAKTFFGCSSLTSIVLSSDAHMSDFCKDFEYYNSYEQFFGCPLDFQSVKALRRFGFCDNAF